MVTAGIVCSLVGAHAGGPRSLRGAKPVPCVAKCKDAHPFIKSSQMHSSLHSISLASNTAGELRQQKTGNALPNFQARYAHRRLVRPVSSEHESRGCAFRIACASAT